MKLHTSQAPNPFRVDVFLAEKGITDVPRVEVGIQNGETRGAAFRQLNSLGELPVLELDDGTLIAESVAICRYFEDAHPEVPLMGASPAEAATVEMWNRRMELMVMEPIAQVARHTFELFADKYEQVPAYAQTQERLAQQRWRWLEEEWADGRPFAAGEQFSIADITGMAALLIAGFAGLEVPGECARVKRWEAAMRGRASWPQ